MENKRNGYSTALRTDGDGWLFQKKTQREFELSRLREFAARCVCIVNVKRIYLHKGCLAFGESN